MDEHIVNIVSWPLVSKRISEENIDSIIIPLGKYVLKIVTHYRLCPKSDLLFRPLAYDVHVIFKLIAWININT